MNAICMHRTGGPSVLKFEEADLPLPGRGEFLIRIGSAGVNPVDTKIREGKFKLFKAKLPAIIGRDISGVIVQAGPHRAKSLKPRFKPGDSVFGMLDYDRGAYAQFTVASSQELALRPKQLKELEAGSLGVAALTAWQGLFDNGHLRKGQRVLIHGAAGGVGHFAVQFAKIRGATVIATAGKRDLAWVRRLGADQVIDYKNQQFEEETGDIDLVFDLIAGDIQDRSWKVLKKRGGAIVSTLTQPSRVQARRHHARGMRMVVAVKSKQLDEIARLIVAKRVRAVIGKEFPLAKARQAHEWMEQKHVRGKIVLKVSE
jgi:NADPH:quinone reductase-like Zn-dependent oxidoreductase